MVAVYFYARKKNSYFSSVLSTFKTKQHARKRHFFLQHDDLACENLGSDITEVPDLMKSVLSFHIA